MHILRKHEIYVFLLGLAGKVSDISLAAFMHSLTDVIGLLDLKRAQDELPPENHYIRYMAEIPLSRLPRYDEDELELSASAVTMLQVIVCMRPASSRRLAAAHYLQSDIAFKRVSKFFEFEIGGLDHNANMGEY